MANHFVRNNLKNHDSRQRQRETEINRNTYEEPTEEEHRLLQKMSQKQHTPSTVHKEESKVLRQFYGEITNQKGRSLLKSNPYKKALDNITAILRKNLLQDFFEFNSMKHKRMSQSEVRLWKKIKKEAK